MSDSEIDPKVISLWRLRSIDANYLKSKYASMESVAHLHIQAADLIDALAAERKELDATVRLLSKVQTKLIAELAAARKDASVMRRLLNNASAWVGSGCAIECRTPDAPSCSCESLQDAIHAAMKEPT